MGPGFCFLVGVLRVKLLKTRLASHTCHASLSLFVFLGVYGAVIG